MEIEVDFVPSGRNRQAAHIAGSKRLRQDYDTPFHRRLAELMGERRSDRGLFFPAKADFRAVQSAPRRDGFPKLRDLAAYDGVSKRRLSFGRQRGFEERKFASAWQKVLGRWGLGRNHGSAGAVSLRRTTAAGRAGARAGRRTGSVSWTSRCIIWTPSCANRCASRCARSNNG